jgi:hypothetical protein
MTRWPKARRPPLELPEWLQLFDIDAWRDPEHPWSEWHAQRRWCDARSSWLAKNPAAAAQACEQLAASMSQPLTPA